MKEFLKSELLFSIKTGTITHQKKSDVTFEGTEIQEFDLKTSKSLVKNSNHPLSKGVYEFLEIEDELACMACVFPFENFKGSCRKRL